MKRFFKNMMASWFKPTKQRPASRQGRRARPMMEQLEDRQLLSIVLSSNPVTDMTQWAQQTVAPPPNRFFYLNFDGNGSNISAFQPQPGQNRDAAIQDIMYRVSEIFSPFNVTVARETGVNSYVNSAYNTTVFIGGNTNNISINQTTGLATKYTYSVTPFPYDDYASQFGGFDHQLNSDLFDLSFIDPMQTSGPPVSQAAASNPANWTNVQSDLLIAQSIAHEVGHTFGLAHVTSSPTQDIMSYDAANSYFANKTFNITDLNNTGTKLVTDAYHERPYSEYLYNGAVIPVPIQTQNSFTYLEALYGDRQSDGKAHYSDRNSVDPSSQNNASARALTPGTTFLDGVGFNTGYNVYSLTVATTQQVHLDVQPQSQLDPIIMVHDASGNLLFFNHASGTWSNAHIDFQATAGQTYSIIVGTENNNWSGSFLMSMTANAPVPNLTGALFKFTNDANPDQVIGTLQIASEDVNTGSFRGGYTSVYGVVVPVGGTVSNPTTTTGITTSNLSFGGIFNSSIPVIVSYSGKLSGDGIDPSMSWSDVTTGRITDGAFAFQTHGATQTPSVAASTVAGTTVNLTVLGNGATGVNPNLIYHWAAVAGPTGGRPTFSANDTNAAQNSTVIFDMAGSYTFELTIIDNAGIANSSPIYLNVTVNQSLTSIIVSPGTANVLDGASATFDAAFLDQFGRAMTSRQTVTWSLAPGSVGTVRPGHVSVATGYPSEIYTAPTSGRGAAILIATSGSISGGAAIHVLDGTTEIDIGPLTDPYLLLDGKSVSPSSSQRLTLTPGSHQLLEVAGGGVSFAVNPDGTVSYDPALEGILNGQGTDQLTVNGALVTVNAQALTDPYLSLDYYTAEKPGTFQVRVLPGSHQLIEAAGGNVSFAVNPDGTVSYDPALEGILAGQGTSQLTVNGAAITINAQALTDPNLAFDYYTAEKPGTFQARVLPGSHELIEAGGGNVSFVVNPNGTVSYDPSLQGILAGQDTSQLTVNGATVTIDASALADSSVAVDYHMIEQTNATFQLVLLPGTHTIRSGDGSRSVTFTVSDNGTISFPASEDSLLSLQDGATLIVKALS
jgi:hypothetical protein